MQDFINNVAFGRGVEQVLVDIASLVFVFQYVVERRSALSTPNVERILAAARGRIHFCSAATIPAATRRLSISPRSFDRLFVPERRNSLTFPLRGQGFAPTAAAPACGLSRGLLTAACGSLQTIHHRAAGESHQLKREFGGKIALHVDLACNAIFPPNSRFSS